MHRSRTILAAAVLLGAVILAARLVPASSTTPGPKPAADTAFVQVGSGESAAGAFVAWPVGDKPAPGIVVVHEWWGLNEQIRQVAMRLAQQGYVAIVPDLYHGKVTDDPMKAHELMRGLDEDEALGTLQAAVTWLRAQPRAAKTKLGSMGFCMGGGLSLGLALRGSGLSAAVMFYGSPVTDPAKLAKLAVPLLGHFGEQDEGIPPKKVDEFRAALKKAGKPAEIYEYPGAGHAFMHEGRDSYRTDAARQAWARTLSFLQKNLRG